MQSTVIVGGGVVGTSLAYALRERGHEITVLEKDGLGAGTTGKSIACFGWYPHVSGHEHELVSRSWEIYSSHIDDGTLTYHESGLLQIARTETAFEELKIAAAALGDHDVPAEVLDSAAVSDYHVNPDAVGAGAAFFPTVGRLDPAEIVSLFANIARDHGVTVETGVEVTDVLTDGGAVSGVETTEGTLDADAVINAAGPWARRLNAMVGLSFPLKHTYAPITVLDTRSNVDLPTVILEDGLYFTGERSAKVLAGHAPHESSEEALWEAAHQFASPGRVQGTGIGSVSEDHRRVVAEEAPRVIPKLEDAEVSNEWLGLRCVTPDYRPIFGPTSVDGFHVATGMSGWGITTGPACAHLLAEHLTTGEMNDTLAYLSPSRFEETDVR